MDLARVITGRWRSREWRPGRHFGRGLARLPPPRRSPVPLYFLGTAARIERLRSWYAKPPSADSQMTDADLAPVFRRWSA
jgi:hypothetical protein